MKRVKKDRVQIFFTSFMQVGLVAINTLFITRLFWVGIFIVSFLISLIWCFNVSKISVSKLSDKLLYALGAGCGAVVGLGLVKMIL
jgi:TM2 domain-containing membrane protein YozV